VRQRAGSAKKTDAVRDLQRQRSKRGCICAAADRDSIHVLAAPHGALPVDERRSDSSNAQPSQELPQRISRGVQVSRRGRVWRVVGLLLAPISGLTHSGQTNPTCISDMKCLSIKRDSSAHDRWLIIKRGP
jgi:hypothetical protein